MQEMSRWTVPNSMMIRNNIDEMFDKLFKGLNDRIVVNLDNKKYVFNQVYTYDDDIAQKKLKLEIAQTILSRFIQASIDDIYEKHICILEHQDCDCDYISSSFEFDYLVDNIMINAQPPEGDITIFQPDKPSENGCFYFNHLTEEEQQITIKGLNKQRRTILIYPCTNPVCFMEADKKEIFTDKTNKDEELAWFLKFKKE
jgi:hypothetical protein